MAEVTYLNEIEYQANTVLTVGTFDGIHEGHKTLINTVVSKARKRGARSVVITFDPHPRDIINPGSDGIKLLTTLKERAEIMKDFGIDTLLVIPFTRDFSLLSSEEFVRNIIYKKVGVSEFIIGYDHHFGRDREGSIDTIERLGKELGFDAYVVSKKEMENTTVSSTVIRKTLANEGDVKKAAEFLGRPYILNGIVIHGNKRGRKLGFPTANIKPEHENKVIPKSGIYVVKVRVDAEWFGGMMSIGINPTFENQNQSIEVNIFDFDREIYGKNIQIRFIERLRDEEKFDDLEDLKDQLRADKKSSLEILSSYN